MNYIKNEDLKLEEIPKVFEEGGTSLFFDYRAVRHGGSEPNKSRVDKLLSLIRQRVQNKKLK